MLLLPVLLSAVVAAGGGGFSCGCFSEPQLPDAFLLLLLLPAVLSVVGGVVLGVLRTSTPRCVLITLPRSHVLLVGPSATAKVRGNTIHALQLLREEGRLLQLAL